MKTENHGASSVEAAEGFGSINLHEVHLHSLVCVTPLNYSQTLVHIRWITANHRHAAAGQVLECLLAVTHTVTL